MLSIAAVCSTLVALACVSAATQAAPQAAAPTASIVTAAELKWVDVPDTPVKMATVKGDAAKGAHASFMKLPAGFSAPLHSHTADHDVVVVAGTLTMTPEGGAAKKLGPGSKNLPQEGARDIVILSHPYDDGIFREDAHWILNRLHLRPALINDHLHWLETTPGDSKAVDSFLDRLLPADGKTSKTDPLLPPVKGRHKLIPSFAGGLVGTLLLLALFATALPLDISAGTKAAVKTGLRIAIDARGKMEAAAVPEGFTLPEGADAE